MADATHLDVVDLYDGFMGEWLPVRGPVSTTTQISYVNRVWSLNSDGANTPGFVRWTTEAEDSAGASYPASRGAFGVDTSDYCIESRVS